MNPYEAPQTAPTDRDWSGIYGFAWGVLCTVAAMVALHELRWLGWI